MTPYTQSALIGSLGILFKNFFPPVLLKNKRHTSVYKFKAYIQHHGLTYIYCDMMTTVGSANIHLLIRYNKKEKERKKRKRKKFSL